MRIFALVHFLCIHQSGLGVSHDRKTTTRNSLAFETGEQGNYCPARTDRLSFRTI